MIHSICIIDNGIPAIQENLIDIETDKQLDANTLKYLLRDTIDWTDSEVNLKILIDKLISDKENWEVSAFLDPKFFMDYISNNLTRPEIIVYDWQFPTTATGHTIDNEEILYRILNENFSVVFIFSGADKTEEIRTLIESERFKTFDNRIFLIDKNASDASGEPPEEILLKKVNTIMEYFSFKFGTKIRQKSMEAVDKILANLGKATLKDVSAYFKLTDDTKRDLVDFIGERFKNRLHGIDLEELPEETEVPAGTYDEKLAKELWAERLYFDPGESDNIVRRGDIIYKVADGTDTLYLIVSADCDLDKFWRKCFGNINVIPLVKIDSTLKEKLLKTVKKDALSGQFTQASLTSRINCLVEGPFVLPFININGILVNYLVCPKEIFNINISPPKDEKGKPLEGASLKNERLKYSYWSEYRRIMTVSEPFISPLIEHILKSLSGYGVPDYPKDVKNTIHKISKEALG